MMLLTARRDGTIGVFSSLSGAKVGRWCSASGDDYPDRCCCWDPETGRHGIATHYVLQRVRRKVVYRSGRCPHCAKPGEHLYTISKEGAAMKKAIRDLRQLCQFFGADTPDGLNRRIYKDTDCGASLSLYLKSGATLHNGDPRWRNLPMTTPISGFTIQTIVEGSEAEVNSELFRIPCTQKEVTQWIAYMEAEAAALWRDANEGTRG